jgi:hypothetical protein
MNAMNSRTLVIWLLVGALIGMAPAFGQTPSQASVTAGAFPREIDDRGYQIVVYQPQISSWKNGRLEARAAAANVAPFAGAH